MSFAQLIGDMEEAFNKAQATEEAKDEKISQAAEEGAQAGSQDDAGSEDKGEGDLEEPEGEEGEGAGEAPMAKALKIVLDDGTEMEAFDGGEMLKSFGERMDTSEAQIKTALGTAVKLMNKQTEMVGQLTKSFNQTVAEQAELIKSLRVDIDALRNQPAGRKSAANPAEVTPGAPLAKSLPAGDQMVGMAPQEFLAKCLSLQKDGKLSLQEVATAEASIGHGAAVPQHIVSTVFSN